MWGVSAQLAGGIRETPENRPFSPPGIVRAFSPDPAVAVVATRPIRSDSQISGEPTMLSKLFSLGLTSLLGLGLAAAFPPQPRLLTTVPRLLRVRRRRGSPARRTALRKAYHLLRRLRSDNRTAGRPEERLRDWTERATVLYRDAVKAQNAGDERKAHEYGVAAHDLARAVDHARSAAQFDRSEPDPDLPPPPAGTGPESDKDRVAFDLRNAYDHIRDQLDKNDQGKDADVLQRRRSRPLQRGPARRRGRPLRTRGRARPRRRGPEPRQRTCRPRHGPSPRAARRRHGPEPKEKGKERPRRRRRPMPRAKARNRRSALNPTTIARTQGRADRQ